ncbi:MAG: hypothetical protein M3272_01390 [Actinomycetota bacterium]|nr:hypothetical protein [Actinomycetota bacterium]
MLSIIELPRETIRPPPFANHPSQIPLRLLRRALRVSAWEDYPVVSFFTGACTVTIAAKEPNRAFRGGELLLEFAAELA